MDSNLLKEAIADAKAVRQTALANAKAALEEAFGARLEAMLSPKLEEETVDAIQPPTAPVAAPSQGLAQEEAVNEADIEEIMRELENELPQDETIPGAVPGAMPPAPAPVPGVPPSDATAGASVPSAPVPPAPAGVPPAPTDAAPPVPAPEGQQEMDDQEMDEEIDINELLESLKAEEEEEQQEMDESVNEEEQEECINESVPVKSSGIGGSDNKEPSTDACKSSGIESSGKSVKSATVGTPEHTQTSQGDDATKAKRPNQAPHATKTNLSTPGGKLTENTGGSTPGYPEGAKKKSTGDDPAEVSDTPNAGPITPENMSTPALHKENVNLKKQLKEAEETLHYLRGQLNEINLLNAKLLYTNRLFKEYSMDNQKKMKIVEMFDLAKNVREVKMTYAVIAESLNFGAETKKRIPSKVQHITEGMASRPVAGTAPGKQIIAESAVSDMKVKFQRLAGIKPSQPTKK